MPHQPPNPGDRAPVLKARARPAGGPADAADGPFTIERLSALSHELNNLLDGSLRCLSLARRALTGDRTDEEQFEAARRRIETVYTALERMADLVHAAMKGSSSVVGSPNLVPSHPITLEVAISHAAEVVGPEADERAVDVVLAIAPEVAQLPAGPLYSVVLNALRNALESIARVAPDELGQRRGHIDVSATLKPVSPSDDPGVDLVLIEVRDDGRGFPNIGDPNMAFDLGFTTKPGSLGIGLALAREVIREIGGMIELARRDESGGGAPRAGRPGAVLRICYPVPRDKPRS